MKKIVSFLFLALILAAASDEAQAQRRNTTTEVLYFKDQLRCCKARACNALEAEVKKVVETNFPDGQVTFKQIKLSDPENSELIAKFGAASQTVIVMSKRRKKENVEDISDVLKKYTHSRNKVVLEQELVEKITAAIL